jgi:hypothetical protein
MVRLCAFYSPRATQRWALINSGIACPAVPGPELVVPDQLPIDWTTVPSTESHNERLFAVLPFPEGDRTIVHERGAFGEEWFRETPGSQGRVVLNVARGRDPFDRVELEEFRTGDDRTEYVLTTKGLYDVRRNDDDDTVSYTWLHESDDGVVRTSDDTCSFKREYVRPPTLNE